MKAIRGAITIKANTEEEIEKGSITLMQEIIRVNYLKSAEVIICSTTKDITAAYPVTFIRKSGLIESKYFSCLEPDINGGMKLCIRLLVLVNDNCDTQDVYLCGAKDLKK